MLNELTYNARKALENITNIVTGESGVSSYNQDTSQGALGKLTIGNGSKPIQVQISTSDFQGLKKILNLN